MRLSPYRRSASGSERDFPLGFHPHLHILVSDGSFHENDMFSVSPTVDTKTLEQIFRHKVLKMLLTKDKITQDMIALLDKWPPARKAYGSERQSSRSASGGLTVPTVFLIEPYSISGEQTAH